LKRYVDKYFDEGVKSPPAWGCGLKLIFSLFFSFDICRPPRGGVD